MSVSGFAFSTSRSACLPGWIAPSRSSSFMTRAAPQLNLFAVGFPAAMLCGFLFLLLSLPTIGEGFASLVEGAFGFVAGLFGADPVN